METEKALEKIRRQIVQKDKAQRRMLVCVDLAIERITAAVRIAEFAKRHHLSEEKVRRYIDRAIFLAQSYVREVMWPE